MVDARLLVAATRWQSMQFRLGKFAWTETLDPSSIIGPRECASGGLLPV